MEGVAARAAQHAELIGMVVVVTARLCCSKLWIRGMNYGHQIQKCTPFVFQTQSEALFSRSDVVLALQTIRHIESPQVDAHITIVDGCIYAVAEMNAKVDRSRFSVEFSSFFVNFCQVTLQICSTTRKHATTKINRMSFVKKERKKDIITDDTCCGLVECFFPVSSVNEWRLHPNGHSAACRCPTSSHPYCLLINSRSRSSPSICFSCFRCSRRHCMCSRRPWSRLYSRNRRIQLPYMGMMTH